MMRSLNRNSIIYFTRIGYVAAEKKTWIPLAVIKSLKLAMRIFSSSKTEIMRLEFFIIFVSTEVVKYLGMKNQAH